jgi:hypothetical protein
LVDESLDLPFLIRYVGGYADARRLDFYDGADSLFGFAKALQLTNHYLITGNVAFQAPRARGAKLYMLTSRSGKQIVQLVLEHPKTAVWFMQQGYSVAKLGARHVYDFTRTVFSRTVGKKVTPETDLVRAIEAKHAPDLNVLSEAIDGPLKDAHRTIGQSSTTTQLGSLDKPFVTFDQQTFDYVRTRIVSKKIEEIHGTIAAYNVNSRRGRVFDPAEGRTIPFEPDGDVRLKDTTPLTWSLYQQDRGRDGTIHLEVRRMLTLNNETKKYYLRTCRRIDE